MNDDGQDSDEEAHDQHERVPLIELPGREPHDGGQITIPSREREYYDVEHRDAVDVYVATDDFALVIPAVMVHHDGAVRIPKRLRDLYGIEDGEPVDIGIHPTGRRYDD